MILLTINDSYGVTNLLFYLLFYSIILGKSSCTLCPIRLIRKGDHAADIVLLKLTVDRLELGLSHDNQKQLPQIKIYKNILIWVIVLLDLVVLLI